MEPTTQTPPAAPAPTPAAPGPAPAGPTPPPAAPTPPPAPAAEKGKSSKTLWVVLGVVVVLAIVAYFATK